MNQLRSIKDYSELQNKTVFLRVDFNVPISGGRVSDPTKIEKLKDTITKISNYNCKIVLASHLGRPQKEGKEGLSLLPVKNLSEKITFHNRFLFLGFKY